MLNKLDDILNYLYDRYKINEEKQLLYKNVFIGVLITLDFKNNMNIDVVNTFLDDNIRLLGLHNVRKIYNNINEYTNNKYIEDLRKNYKLFSRYDNFDEIERLTRNLSDKINSVDDMLKYTELFYRDVKCNDYGVARLFFENKVPQNIYNTLSKYREKQMLIDKSNIPYIKGNIYNIEYETVRVWDSYLMYFDIENINDNILLKQKLMTNPNYRLITLKKNNKIINHILVNKSNNKYTYKVLKNDGYDYSEIINNIDNDIKSSNIFKDPVKVYTSLDKDELEYYRMKEVYDKAFKTSKLIVSRFSSVIKNSKNRKTYVGRDFMIITDESLNDKIDIIFIVRHNEDLKNKLGSDELFETLKDIIRSTNKKIEIDCYRTSYYLIAKLASNGIIYIDQDNLYNKLDIINQYRIDGKINNNFPNIINSNNYSIYYDNNKHNKVSFYSTDNMNLSDKQKLEVEYQKILYSIILKRLVEERNKY